MTAIDVNADGTSLVSAAYDGSVKLWSLTTFSERMVLSGHKDMVMSCRFSRDGRFIATASFDRTVRVWDARTGAVLHILRGFPGVVRACSFSADGRYLACGDWAMMIHILDWESEREVAVYQALGNLLRS